MLPTTPFSGLSLFTHLLIILIAKVYGVFLFIINRSQQEIMAKRIKLAAKPTQNSWAVIALKRVLSIFVILTMMAATLTFITIAIQTAIRTGEDEVQRNFIQSRFNYTEEKESTKNMTPYVTPAAAPVSYKYETSSVVVIGNNIVRLQ